MHEQTRKKRLLIHAIFPCYDVIDRLPEEGSEPTISDKPAILTTLHDACAQDWDHHRRHCPRCKPYDPSLSHCYS
jgi:hypothetical protein